jgi:hypothetical protein
MILRCNLLESCPINKNERVNHNEIYNLYYRKIKKYDIFYMDLTLDNIEYNYLLFS